MKATELMIRDWVYGLYPNGSRYANPFRISAVDIYPLNRSPRIVTMGGYGFYEEYLEPIPLTREILEKNGFKDAPRKDTDAHNLAGKWWHKSGDVYVKRYCLSHDTYVYTVGFHPYTRIENIRNVHELQHALHLCGLNELADNFQI